MAAPPSAFVSSLPTDQEHMVSVRTVLGVHTTYLLQPSSSSIPKSLSPADSGVSDYFPAATLSNRSHQLVAAVRDGDASLALKLLKSSAGCEVINDTIDNKRNTLLHIASASGDSRLVLALVTRGADVSARNNFGMTPLHCAASYGMSPAIVAILLRHGADPNAIDQDGDTPLMSAISLAHVPVVQQLLAARADLSLASPNVSAAEVSRSMQLTFLTERRDPATPRMRDRARVDRLAASGSQGAARCGRCVWTDAAGHCRRVPVLHNR